MKKDIHPKFFANAQVTCACGATYKIGSTKEKINVEICSACHPFYTGNEKILDTAGRVERFRNKVAGAKTKKDKTKAEAKNKTEAKTKAETKVKTEEAK